MEKILEVVSISRATDFLTGKNVYSVQFGTVLERKNIEMTTAPPIISVAATIFVDFKDECPYKVGSKWNLHIEDTGKVSIKPV